MRNTRQEIEDAFENQYRGDLPPPAVFTQTGTVGQMEACGARWPEANYFNAAGNELLTQVDVLSLTVRAELFPGRGDTQPSIRSSPYRRGDLTVPTPPEDIMDPEEFVSGGRCRVVADVADRIRRENGDLFVTAGMIDAPGIASQLLGAENALMGYLLDRDVVTGWSKAMDPYARAYAKALSESADNVTIIGSASLDIISPEMYHELTEPYLIKWFIGEVGGRCRMFGAIHPTHTLLMGSPEDVLSQARRSADAGFDIVTPECGVPPLTPDANLQALAHYRDP